MVTTAPPVISKSTALLWGPARRCAEVVAATVKTKIKHHSFFNFFNARFSSRAGLSEEAPIKRRRQQFLDCLCFNLSLQICHNDFRIASEEIRNYLATSAARAHRAVQM